MLIKITGIHLEYVGSGDRRAERIREGRRVDIMLDMHYLIALVEPCDVDRKEHVFHPYRVISRLVEDEEQPYVIIKIQPVTEALLPLAFITSEFERKSGSADSDIKRSG